ncbi:hypothetical protein ACLB2K_049895 [Fragaria x ananassa]
MEVESSGDLFHHHYITTRSYRSPEILLRMFLENEKLRPFEYDEKVDMWAVGDPSNRPSAAEALRHPFITRARNVLAATPGFTGARNVASPPGFSCCPRPMMRHVVNKNVPKMTSRQPIY